MHAGKKRRTPRIMAPFNCAEEVNDLAETGAGELYCGVRDPSWLEKYLLVGINRRIELHANLKDFSELERSVKVAHSYQVSVALTLNEHYYTYVQHDDLLAYARKAVDSGIDALIVADPGIVLALRENGFTVPLHLSTGGTVFNARAARFYARLGISRVTIPRHLTIAEIRRLVAVAGGIETAVFILNSRCANIDGFCTFDHMPLKCPNPAKLLGEQKVRESPPQAFSKDIVATGCCNLPYSIEFHDSMLSSTEWGRLADAEKAQTALFRQSLWDRHHIDNIPCGACALYDLREMGVTSVKIVGRGNPIRRKVGDIGFLRMLLALLEHDDLSRDEYREAARNLYQAHYKRGCHAINCYYPELAPEREERKPDHNEQRSDRASPVHNQEGSASPRC